MPTNAPVSPPAGEPKNQPPFTTSPQGPFYTFRRQVRLLPGQTIRFLKGLGYYVVGKGRQPAAVTMFDSVTISEIPPDAQAVAGYVGGLYPTFARLAVAFPHAHRLSIAVNASQDADCLDVEPGDATIEQAPAWVKRQVARDVKLPVLYTSVSNVPALIHALTAAGIRRSTVRIWSAHYTDKEHRCTQVCCGIPAFEADATQWTNRALGRNLDQSLCKPGFFS